MKTLNSSGSHPIKMRPLYSLICAFFLVLVSLGLPATSIFASPDKADRLLLLGDSLGAGYGLQPGKEWASLLQEKIDQAGIGVVIANASISGDTTAGGVARIEALLEREQPKWVLIELGGNDGLRGMPLQAMRNNLQLMVAAVTSAGAQPMLLGMKIPPNYGRKYTERFEQVFQQVAQENKVPLLPFLLEGVGGNDQLMQADRLHPNESAQPIIAELVWRFIEPKLKDTD